jgi:voltage-gated potassium channel Kch
MRVWRDVFVATELVGGELAVMSDVPGVVDEVLTLGLLGPDGQLDVRVKVLESNPQIDDGIVRHRLKLLMLDAAS